MKKKLQNFLNEVVDLNLPVEQQSQVFSVINSIGGVAENSSCSNSSISCDDAVNKVECINYGVCSNSSNKNTCISKPKPVLPQCVCSGGMG